MVSSIWGGKQVRSTKTGIVWYVYTYEEFVFMSEATAVEQNDRNRTKTDNKKKN